MTPLSRYLAIGKLVALLLLLGWALRLNDLRARWHTQYEHEHAARLQDRTSYENAQKAAAALNQAQIAQVKQQQQEITDNAENRYNADIARLRADLTGRLQQTLAAAKGAPGSAAASDLPNAAAVPDDPARVSIPTGLYVRGAELELQLERLQDWVRSQSAVDPNKVN